MEKNLTTGSVPKTIFLFSVPYLLSYFMQTLYGMADLFIIGRYEGAASITAVSIGSQVMHMITVVIVGLAMGTTVTIAQAVGAGERERVHRAIGNTATLFFVLSLVLAGVLIGFVDEVLSLMATPAEAMEGTRAYLVLSFFGIPLITAYNVMSSIYRGMGDSRSPMCFIAAACVLNIALDFLFIGAWEMGPVGAALGTVLAQAASVVLALLFMRRADGEGPARADFLPHAKTMRKLLRIGIPIAVQDGFIQIAFLVITVIANGRGLTDAAAVGIVEKIISFIFLVPSSMLSTVSALGAQNIGAGKGERAVETLRYALLITAGFGILVSVLTQLAADDMVAAFTRDASVVLAGGAYLRGYIYDCIFAGIHFSFSGYFCACGRSELSFLHNAAAILTARIPLVYLASIQFPDTLFPMGIATVFGSIESVVICVLAFFWLRRRQGERGIQ